MSALLSAKQNSERLNAVRDKVRADNGGQIDMNYGTVRNTSSGAAEAVANAKDKAASDSLNNVDGPLKWLLNSAASLSELFPTVTTGLYEFGTTLAAAGASLGIFSYLHKSGVSVGKGIERAVSAGSKLSLADSAMTPALIGTIPLATMYKVTNWAGDTTHDKSRSEFLLNISTSLEKIFGDKEAEYAAMRKKNQEGLIDYKANPIRVIVDVQNGNIVASVNEANSRQASRK